MVVRDQSPCLVVDRVRQDRQHRLILRRDEPERGHELIEVEPSERRSHEAEQIDRKVRDDEYLGDDRPAAQRFVDTERDQHGWRSVVPAAAKRGEVARQCSAITPFTITCSTIPDRHP